MANSAFHKRQAEELIMKYNEERDKSKANLYVPDPHPEILKLAKIHALLAQVPDEAADF